MKNMSKRAGQKTLDFFLTKKSKPSYEDSENEKNPIKSTNWDKNTHLQGTPVNARPKKTAKT